MTLASVDVRNLEAFQGARFGMKSADLSLSPRHALRLLRLIDRRNVSTASTAGLNSESSLENCDFFKSWGKN